jgi:protocatechuate 3,4-dioxygenase beta subunit
MDNDDALVGRVWGRRDVVRWLAAGGVAAGVAPALILRAARGAGGPESIGFEPVPGCVVQPEMTEGPFYVDQRLERSDIRSEPSTRTAKAGVPLALAFRVSQVGATGCTPLPGAVVDVWHCDAAGVYSGVSGNAAGETFLRGWQRTDARGEARFTTIYPGWYRGRAVHIHFKIRTASASAQPYEFTSQLFFDEALTDSVHAASPYTETGRRDTRNESDGIFRDAGRQMILAPRAASSGYAAVFDVGLDLSNASVGRPDGTGGRGPRPRGRRL